MSFSSLEAGHGTSAGAADYPLRTLVRDRLQRDVQRALDALLPDHGEGHSDPPDRSDEEFAEWLRLEESPLLLENVEEFVRDPEAHLRALAERVGGPPSAGRIASQLPTDELVVDARQQQAGDNNKRDSAEELRARLRTLAKLDSERILAVPRRRGTPKGETRTHYLLLVSPDHDILNSVFKRLVLEIVRRRWPGAVVVGYVHRDTDNTHLHLWISAATLSGKKISVAREAPSGDAVLDKYPDLDEEVARSVSGHFNDPSIYDDHLARKLEWVHWRERFEEALRRGERPPVMPHRARHDYDWVGERRAVSNRERDESRTHTGAREKAAPMPRAKSLMGALELWGKTLHLEARVNYRRALLDSLDAWREHIDYPAESMKRHFELKLEAASRDHERYKNAFEKTLENRARKGYPALKYPLHNSKQIVEMEDIARLTRDPELLRHVRSYTELDRSTGDEGLARVIAVRWADEIEARFEVAERGVMLQRSASSSGSVASSQQIVDASVKAKSTFDKDGEIVRGWLRGGWTVSQMRSSLGCFENEATRRHGERYVKAHEYRETAEEMFADSRAGAERLLVRPVLDASQIERITALFSLDHELGLEERERTYFRDVAALSMDDRSSSTPLSERLSKQEKSVPARMDSNASIPEQSGETPHHAEILRPHDEQWMAKLILSAELKAVGALAMVLVGDGGTGSIEDALNDARMTSDRLDLARSVRLAAGISQDPPPAALSAFERCRYDGQHEEIAQQLREPDLDWTPQQIAAVEELMDCLPLDEYRRAEHAVTRERTRREEQGRREALENIHRLLDGAGEMYVETVYRADGLEALRNETRFEDRVWELAGRYEMIVTDGGIVPEESGLDWEALNERAWLKLTAAVTRYEGEERESEEIALLDGRATVAGHESAAARLRREWFQQHWPFVEWNYQTSDGRGFASLMGSFAEMGEQLSRRGDGSGGSSRGGGSGMRRGGADEARLLVCESENEHIIEASQERFESLRAEEARLTAVWQELREEHAVRLGAHRAKGLKVEGARFAPEDWARLEALAAETRNVSLVTYITRVEESVRGVEYAAQRALGRGLAAEAVEHGEYRMPAKYDRLPEGVQFNSLPAQLRQSLTAKAEAHTAARNVEKSAAFSYRAATGEIAAELAARYKAEMGREARPLVSVREAELLAVTWRGMDPHSRYQWERKLSPVHVMAVPQQPGAHGSLPGTERNTGHAVFGEWQAKAYALPSHEPAGKFRTIMEGREVLSYREAQPKDKSRATPERGGSRSR